MPGTGEQALLAQRVGALLGQVLQLARVGHELARDRVVGVGAVDEAAPCRA